MGKPGFLIGDRQIGPGHSVFIMAEAGSNHNGDLNIAKQMVRAAKVAGADCVKFQTFTAEEFCLDRTKTFTYKSQGKEITESEFELLKRFEFTRDEWVDLMAYCKEQEIMFLTTVQDPVNLHMMQDLGLLAIKVGSDDFDHLVNLKTYAKTGIPLIISKGMSDMAEVKRVVGALSPLATGGLCVLHCVSLYPSEPEHLNIKQIETLARTYPDVVWGFSDHSHSTVAPALAVMLGARVIEKHFTLDKAMEGPDHWFSMNPEELKEMVDNIRFAEAALGDGVVAPHKDELCIRKVMRRRILAKEELLEGHVLGEESVMFKRADHGAFAGEWDNIIGKSLSVRKDKGDGIEVEDV